jgi:hypothetical protein
MTSTRILSLTTLLLILGLTGCAKHQLYRDDLALCQAPEPEQACPNYALQQVLAQGHDRPAYLLGFVEFDDQGQLFSRPQLMAITDQLNTLAAKDDLLMVVFVHGWKHSAAPGDEISAVCARHCAGSTSRLPI